jgi:hypothetical protein
MPWSLLPRRRSKGGVVGADTRRTGYPELKAKAASGTHDRAIEREFRALDPLRTEQRHALGTVKRETGLDLRF